MAVRHAEATLGGVEPSCEPRMSDALPLFVVGNQAAAIVHSCVPRAAMNGLRVVAEVDGYANGASWPNGV